ncbi:MAG: type II toxin-antitoxin system prevent-host-death family antitoxin [Rhodobacteraceae bacterium]|nr:MAG: type II toxin-antitoxin system prevent-host-death family antitoxin [Paracoccaceae bacterium]
MQHNPIIEMQKYPAADLARNTSALLRAASAAPITITKHNKECFVIMSTEAYKAMTQNSSTQHAFAVADMPDNLGDLLDRGLKVFLEDE